MENHKMAKARMLHRRISISLQVNRLPLAAQLLFTWMIAHADDEGRLRGEATYIKATVVPMMKWSFKLVESYIESIENEGLIHRWTENNEQIVEFVKWHNYQKIRKTHIIPSTLPSFEKKNADIMSTNRQTEDDNMSSQYNIIEDNSTEFNISEDNNGYSIADDKSPKSLAHLINPKNFVPQTAGESAAFEAWKSLEPNNPLALKTTYLQAYKNGLPTPYFYQFTSEIKQDDTIRNKGAIFNQKVRDHLEGVKTHE